MLYGLLAVIFLAIAGHLAFSAMDRPLKPIPAGVDPVYVLVPAFFFAFGGIVAIAFAFGADWHDVRTAIGNVLENMFAII